MLKILVIGATSLIAQETIRHFAADGAEFFLVGLSADKLKMIQDDLLVRGAKQVSTYELDLTRLDKHQELVDTAMETLGVIDAVLVAHGTLTDQKAAEQNVNITLRELNINFLSAVSLLTILANIFEEQKRGVIAVISSVAGDRGRGSNYVYGTAMGAKSIFLQGLRNRLAKSNVTVLTVKPGFVDTPMTAHLKKNPLYSDPRRVGRAIYDAMKSERDILYVPFFWMFIMMIIRNIPERIFKKLSL